MPRRHFERQNSSGQLGKKPKGPNEQEIDSVAGGHSDLDEAGNDIRLEMQRSVVNRRDSENKSESESTTSGSSSSSSSSDEEENISLQRPVFLKKSLRVAKESDADMHKEKVESAARKRHTLMQKVQHEKRILLAQEDRKLHLTANFSTDKDFLMKVMTLDDNDEVQPKEEEQAWLKRQELRKKNRRDRLLAEQLELEEYVANKLEPKTVGQANSKADAETESPTVSKSKVSNAINKSKLYKPGRLKNIQFTESRDMLDKDENNEYSVL